MIGGRESGKHGDSMRGATGYLSLVIRAEVGIHCR